MFLAFAYRGNAFIEKKTSEITNREKLLELVGELSDYAVKALKLQAESSPKSKYLLKYALAVKPPV